MADKRKDHAMRDPGSETPGARTTQAQWQRTYDLLTALRHVNKLITRVQARDQLLQDACDLLVRDRGYYNVWISLERDDETDPRLFSAGLGDHHPVLADRLQSGPGLSCSGRAMESDTLCVIMDPPSECTDCPLAQQYAGRSALVHSLQLDGVRLGAVCASTPPHLAADGEEQELFRELAEDLSFALSKMKANEERRESRENLRVTLQSIGDGVIAVDAKGRVTLMNPVAEALCGWSQTEAVGRPLVEVFKIINEESRLAVPNPVDRALTEGVTVGLANHSVLIARDGREAPIADSAAPIRNEEGKILGVVLVFRDQTDERAARRALEESKERYRLLFENMAAGFAVHEMIYDESGQPVDYRFLMINPAFERLTSLKAADLVGRTVKEALPGTEPAWIERYGEVVRTGRPDEFEEYSGELDRYYAVKAFRPEKGRFAVIFTDVTRRKKAEHELQQRIDELERINKAAVGREQRMIELKREINELHRRLGESPSYPNASESDSPRRKKWFAR